MTTPRSKLKFARSRSFRWLPRWLYLGGAAWGVIACAAVVWAQADSPDTPPPAPTEQQIEQRRSEAAASPDLETAEKEQIEQRYQQALVELASAKKFAAAATSFRQRAADAPARRAALESAAARGPPPNHFAPADDADLSTLEQLLDEARNALAAAQMRYDTSMGEAARRAVRQRDLPEELTTAQQELAEVDKTLAVPNNAAAAPVALAERTHLLARREALQQQIAALESEASFATATAELVPLERSAAAAELAQLKKSVERLSAAVASKRDDEISRRLRANEHEAQLAPAVVKPVLEENIELTEERLQLAKKDEQLNVKLAANQALLESWQTSIGRTKDKIEAVGLWTNIALELRSQRRNLPDPRTYRGKPRSREDEVRQVQFRRLTLHDAASDLADIDDEVRQTLDKIDPSLGNDEQQAIEFAAEEAYEARREEVRDLLREYDEYFETLTELDAVQRQIAEQSREYANFIDERILWIESTEPIQRESPARFGDSVARWTSAQNWKSLGQAVWGDVSSHPFLYAIVLIALAVWYRYHQRMRRRIGEIGRQVRSNPVVPLRRSFEAFLLTVLVAALWPGVLFLIAWRIGAVASGSAAAFERAIADGVFLAACVYLFLEVPRRFCRGNGIAEAHFLWPAGAVAHLRNTLRSLIFVLAAAAAVIGATESLTGRARDDAIGRAAFAAAMVVVGFFLWRLLRYRGHFMQSVLSEASPVWLIRSRRFVFLPATLIALALAGCALAGYYHTALELTWRIGLSLALLFGLIVAHGLGLRWLVAARVRLARARMMRQRAAESQSATSLAVAATDGSTAGDEADAAAAPPPPTPADEHQIDFATVKLHTSRILLMCLLVVGLLGAYLIWIDMFPALGWVGQVAVGGTTLGHILLAVIAAALALVALRNLSGMLELSFLQHLPLDAGARYAITTLCKYAICIAAVILITWLIGFDWSNVQWLVAAMLVGLGFGLQEIFANFVSGLIILLERPIRPGDWITVGNTDGRVMKINMRATTVRDWDRKELIVPNKEIITGQVVNWSLTENTLRIVIHVGIAYGSDTELATQILYRIVREHPKILEKPKPKVIFREFGDSALVFELRLFIPHLDFWPRVMHETHMAIDREFRAAGITIAFPQRDLHIKTVDGALLQAAGRNGPTGEATPTESRTERS